MRLNEGEIPNPITLREGDFFSETATEINRVIRKRGAEQEKQKVIKEKLDQLLAQGSSEAVREVRELMDREIKE